ncbi:hypothetical protein SDC9_165529 [bioreactor metagenome]|uniref:2-hydroxyglutaryl-CoA dehydratase, D-component n=1 Tax=bioreactor metagenome TaxID=1076179 RepID=A0A645FUJ8_9ZZZZ
MYMVGDIPEEVDLYGGSAMVKMVATKVNDYLKSIEAMLIEAVGNSKRFTPPMPHEKMRELGGNVISYGCNMGEGWVLTAEMMELIHHGFSNIICTQPFGCLPNHITGKGMIRKIKNICPDANIVPIDYDPGATKVNQENRIKLMLAVARENKNKEAI